MMNSVYCVLKGLVCKHFCSRISNKSGCTECRRVRVMSDAFHLVFLFYFLETISQYSMDCVIHPMQFRLENKIMTMKLFVPNLATRSPELFTLKTFWGRQLMLLSSMVSFKFHFVIICSARLESLFLWTQEREYWTTRIVSIFPMK